MTKEIREAAKRTKGFFVFRSNGYHPQFGFDGAPMDITTMDKRNNRREASAISMYRGRDGPLNREILRYVGVSGPVLIYSIKQALNGKFEKKVHYSTVHRRVHDLEMKGYLSKTGTRKVKSGSEVPPYSTTIRGDFAALAGLASSSDDEPAMEKFLRTAGEKPSSPFAILIKLALDGDASLRRFVKESLLPGIVLAIENGYINLDAANDGVISSACAQVIASHLRTGLRTKTAEYVTAATVVIKWIEERSALLPQPTQPHSISSQTPGSAPVSAPPLSEAVAPDWLQALHLQLNEILNAYVTAQNSQAFPSQQQSSPPLQLSDPLESVEKQINKPFERPLGADAGSKPSPAPVSRPASPSEASPPSARPSKVTALSTDARPNRATYYRLVRGVDDVHASLMFKEFKISLKAEDLNRNLFRHTLDWSFRNTSETPIERIPYSIKGARPRTFSQLLLRVTLDEDKVLTTTIAYDDPLHKIFFVSLPQPLKPESDCRLVCSYLWEETPRRFSIESPYKYKRFTMEVRLPGSYEIRPRGDIETADGGIAMAWGANVLSHTKEQIIQWQGYQEADQVGSYPNFKFKW